VLEQDQGLVALPQKVLRQAQAVQDLEQVQVEQELAQEQVLEQVLEQVQVLPQVAEQLHHQQMPDTKSFNPCQKKADTKSFNLYHLVPLQIPVPCQD
jgi:hypothetical protein